MAGLRRVMRRLIIGGALLATATLAPLPAGAPAEDATAAVVAGPRDACGPLLPKRNRGHWRCSFVDNFRGRTLDMSKWIAGDSERSRYRTGVTCYQPGTRNVKVRRGRLVLVARKLEDAFQCGPFLHSFRTRYTGGIVTTKGHFSQTYGRFEVRSKYPKARTSGIHGGFWMHPAYNTYGSWPESGEIDVAEWWSSLPRQFLPSLHYDGRVKRKDSGANCHVRTPSRFHTYTLIWRRSAIRFFIDGKRCFVRRRWTPEPPQSRPQPFDHPFNLILNMGVGWIDGPSPTNEITPKTRFPARYVVAYAKAWR